MALMNKMWPFFIFPQL